MPKTKAPVEPKLPWPFATPERSKILEVWPHQFTGLELCKTFPIVCLHGSVQNGKSYWLNCAGVQRVLDPAHQPPAHSDRVFWVVVPTRAPYWHNFQPVFEKVWGWAAEGGMILERNETLSRYIIKAADGGKPWTCWVRYADKPDTFRTASPDFILATEAALYKPEIFALMQFRVAKMNGPIYMDTSPNGLGWFWKAIIEKAAVTVDFRPTVTGGEPVRTVREKGADPRIALVKGIPIGANRFMKPETLKIMQENMSSDQWRREGLGEAFQSAGLLLHGFNPVKHIVPKMGREAFERSKTEWHFIEGIDYGFTDSTAKCTIAVSGPRYVVVDEYEESGLSLSAHVAVWKLDTWNKPSEKYPRGAVLSRYDDPVQKILGAELRAQDFPVTYGNNDVEAGIDKLNNKFEQNNLLVMDHCLKLIDAIGQWKRNLKTGHPMHPADILAAFRYGVFTHALANDGKPVPQGHVDNRGEVKWKLPDGTVVETSEEAPESQEMYAEDGTLKEVV